MLSFCDLSCVEVESCQSPVSHRGGQGSSPYQSTWATTAHIHSGTEKVSVCGQFYTDLAIPHRRDNNNNITCDVYKTTTKGKGRGRTRRTWEVNIKGFLKYGVSMRTEGTSKFPTTRQLPCSPAE